MMRYNYVKENKSLLSTLKVVYSYYYTSIERESLHTALVKMYKWLA